MKYNPKNKQNKSSLDIVPPNICEDEYIIEKKKLKS